jgi:hypothetical protein
MRGLARLPRYRDPITCNVARLLLRSLQTQHRAPTSTAVELEARFGRQLAAVSPRRFEFPVATATTAIIDSVHQHLVTFESGVTPPVMQGVMMALLEKGFASPSDFSANWPMFAQEDVVLASSRSRRLMCAFGPLAEMQRRSRATMAAVSRDGGGVSGNTTAPLSSSSSSSFVELKNPFELTYGVMVQSAVEKKRAALLDVCCPGWCADLRLALATEQCVPLEPGEALERTPEVVRYRSRSTFPIGSFFTVHLTRTVMQLDTWWHPSLNVDSYCSPSDAARAGVGTVLPTPALFKSAAADRSIRRSFKTGRSRDVQRNVTSQLVDEVEVEVNVKAVLRAWKKVYGGAAASAYLSSASLVSTTVAGTAISESFASPLSAVGADAEQPTNDEVRGLVLAEREDPFLLRVAEDYMALLQYLGRLRVCE